MSAAKGNGFRIIMNDDLDSHQAYDQALFDLWGRTAVTTYSLCIGGDVLNYPSTVRGTVGESLKRAHAEGKIPSEHRRFWHQLLTVEGKDPLAMAVEGCRRNGMEIFASLRMNDVHHGADPDSAALGWLVSPFWREHPEYRAKGWERTKTDGPVTTYPEYRKERWDWRVWVAYSFEHEAIRQRVLDVVADVVERYDVDGFDLDFSRTPPFFDRGRGYECRHHMTDVLRRARAILDKASKKRGKSLKLSAACRQTIAESETEGLDIRAWVEEGLVDILMPCQKCGAGTDLVIEEFVSLAEGTKTEICPNLDNVARPGVTANIYVTSPVVRAAALRFLKGGADGMQFFNFFISNEPGHFSTQLFWEGLFTEVGEPEVMEGKDTFHIFQQGLPVPLTGGKLPPPVEGRGYYWIDLPLDRHVPPPAPGRKESGSVEYKFYIPDDVEAARDAGTLAGQTLYFSIVHARPEDEIVFTLNGEPLTDKAVYALLRDGEPLKSYEYVPAHMDYQVDLAQVKDVRNGWNVLGIEARKLTEDANERFRGLDAVFYDVALSLRYR